MEESKTNQPVIEFQDLSVVYNPGKTSELWALKNISGSIYPRDYTVFFGPSGCGKSTLLYAIAGLEEAVQGKVNVLGKDINQLSEKDKNEFHRSLVGMIFQAYYLIPGLTVKNNILLPMIFTGTSRSKREERVCKLIKKFDIEELANRYPSQLSGGQQQRVAIARALVNDPPIILADEPVGNLDSKNAEIVMNLLTELNEKEKKTVILVTHDARHLERADKIIHMKDGKLERTVQNSKKSGTGSVEKEELTEFKQLITLYPHLSDIDIRAKILARHLTATLPLEQELVIEDAVKQLLSRKISPHEFNQILDKPVKEGGADLYSQKATRLTKEAIKYLKEIEKLEEQTSSSEPDKTKDHLIGIRRFLLDGYDGQLSFSQIKKLDEVLYKRFLGKIDQKKLEQVLDLSEKEGGVGLNKRTARKFTGEIDILFLKRFNSKL